MAGGKVVKVDGVEWVILPDPMVAANAVGAGEVDYLEPAARHAADAPEEPERRRAGGQSAGLSDDPQAQPSGAALQQPEGSSGAALRRRPAGLSGRRRRRQVAAAPVLGGADLRRPVQRPPPASATGPSWAPWTRRSSSSRNSGYKGERVVIMHPTDQTVIGAMTMVTANRLKEAGFNVDLQSTNWASLISRRPIKKSPEQNRGGWNIFHTWGFAGSLMEPLSSSFIASPCDGKNWFGWACDEETRRSAPWTSRTSPRRQASRLRIATRRASTSRCRWCRWASSPSRSSTRKNISGVLTGTRVVLWNLEKKK